MKFIREIPEIAMLVEDADHLNRRIDFYDYQR